MAKWLAMRGMTGSTARTNSVVANTASIDRPSTRVTDGGRAASVSDRGVRASMPGCFYRSPLGAPSGATRGTGMANCMRGMGRNEPRLFRRSGRRFADENMHQSKNRAPRHHRENVSVPQRGNAAYCNTTRDHRLAEFGGRHSRAATAALHTTRDADPEVRRASVHTRLLTGEQPMHIKPALLSASEQRFKQAKFSPTQLDRKLGDGPLDLSPVEIQRRHRQLLALTGDAEAAQVGLERIINGNDLDSINYLTKGTFVSHSVCRIQLKDSGGNLIGYASGFLIGPGVLMTNHHVFGAPGDATNSLADFDYELDVGGMERRSFSFAFEPGKLFYTNDKLDYSIVAVAADSIQGGRKLADWGWLPLNGMPGKGDPGEYLTIIQHPSGQMKQVCVRENKLLK